eukprot:scaffold3886_cov399-Prasinococcus_capsulatus_cf.AAC.11
MELPLLSLRRWLGDGTSLPKGSQDVLGSTFAPPNLGLLRQQTTLLSRCCLEARRTQPLALGIPPPPRRPFDRALLRPSHLHHLACHRRRLPRPRRASRTP